ncbi:unnamed protein product (macronuclear) [Paramecium tetraurelia]|uniref:SnoaL-like domain-containing protein n=1 Tax=Paramecium tetraurelia TaxID=5888 RepID=A0BFZ0_PARTE|nr:uncharacterized protein GSPATT00028492001 [Paramecium tetraurelia]CAK57457.1 unnamed protein product [Paramecium tetraurelia]|eukprot:XP_001424855.1 hypothetical protein (macronuclear) [Paramecium tetraurelia strain d4-2]
MEYTQDQIQDIISFVAQKWDERLFEQAKTKFHSVVEIDYTSLGAPSITQDPIETLCNNWKIVLSGFDKTVHTVKVTQIEQENDLIVVHSSVNAYHFIAHVEEGEEWTLNGRYVHKLKSIEGTLKIVYMKLQVDEQMGNLKLIMESTKRTMQ